MTTYAQASAARLAGKIEIVTIEGLGEYAGLWKFCRRVPAYAIGNSLYKPWMKKGAIPDAVPEECSPLGGVADSGEITVELLDGVGTASGGDYNALTKALGTDILEDLQVGAAMTGATNTGVVFQGTAVKIATIVAGTTVVFCGAEAIRIDAITASSATSVTCSVTRAWLGTDAQAHDVQNSAYLSLPFIEGRRISLFIAYDLSTYSIGEEHQVGPGWRIDSPSMGEYLASYIFTGLSSMSVVNKLVYRRHYGGLVNTVNTASIPIGSTVEHEAMLSLDEISQSVASNTQPFSWSWMRHGGDGGEILSVFQQSDPARWTIDPNGRGRNGTLESAFALGELAEIVFCAAGFDGRSSFAFQDIGSEVAGVGAGVWIQDQRCEHPVPAMLCALTSSATPGNADGFYGNNFVAGSGNYASLPPGIGAGIPMSQIDFASFLFVWYRTLEWRLPNLTLGKAEPVGKWLEREILKVTGLALVVRAGKLRLEFPTIPNIGQGGVTITDADMLTEKIDDGVEATRLSVRRATELSATSIVFLTKQPGSTEGHPIVFNDSDFQSVFGFIRSQYSADVGAIEVPAYSLPSTGIDATALMKKTALRLLWRWRRPPDELVFFLDDSFADAFDVGSLIFVTHRQIPNRTTKTRGWTNFLCWVRSKRLRLRDDEIEVTVLAIQAAGRYGMIAPAAHIESFAGAGPYVLTCAPNRFTDAAIPTGAGLPAVDVAGFAVNDVVRLRNRSGLIVAGTQIVTAINPGANTITINGNFGGTLISDTYLVYGGYAASAAQQQTNFVYEAADATEQIAATAPAWNYGER